ncbi:MAG: [protein-PII] uridylyltransferase, partial [Acidobacteria bacterium RBG_16_68_9]
MNELAISAIERGGEPLAGLGALVLDGAWGRQVRDYLARAKAILFEQHLAGATGLAVVESYTRAVDHVIRALFTAARASYQERFALLDQRCTLVAQGGYGRGELNPCSDIDLLFLYPHRRDRYVDTVTEKLLYALWDTGVTLGHAVRNVRDCVRLAAHDFKVKTALLDARYVAGDAGLYTEFAAAMETEVLKRQATRFFRDKLAENEERHRRYGDSVYLVEPHLKEGEGGLRDLHTAMWLAKVKFKTNSVAELVQKGIVTEGERREIEAARDFLWRVRNGLHFLSGQHMDQLTFEYQERIAADFGYRDDATAKGVERFMRDYYLHAATVNRFSEEIIARCVERPTSYRFIGRFVGREIRPGVRVAAEQVAVGDPAAFRADPSLLVRVLADAQRHGLPIGNATRRLIRENAALLADDRVRCTPPVVAAFFDVLGWKTGVYDALNEMHKLGVLGALLPEFGNLLCMAQYDRTHLYTVDEHSLRGVRILEGLRAGAYKQESPLLTEVMRDEDRVEILYLAMLFHDSGKGQGGDHSNRGAEHVCRVAQRLGLHADEATQLEFLVRQHLTMSHLATRRDLHDEKLILDFAKMVGSLPTLRKLYLLTFADMRATNPKLWNSWHDMLLGELYVRTLAVFELGEFAAPDEGLRARRIRQRVADAIGHLAGPPLAAFLADMPDRYFLSVPESDIPRHVTLVRRYAEEPVVTHVMHFPEREFSEFTVVTRDQPGLFAKLTGVLTAHGMNIVGAHITTSDRGMALDVFRVSHLGRAVIARSDDRWEQIQVTAGRVVGGGLDVEELVAKARRPSSLPEKVVPRVGTRVEVDNDVSEHFTVLDVYTQDRVGVLFAITNTLYHLDLSIHLAKITTNVDQVLDVFYVTDIDGR